MSVSAPVLMMLLLILILSTPRVDCPNLLWSTLMLPVTLGSMAVTVSVYHLLAAMEKYHAVLMYSSTITFESTAVDLHRI